MFITIVMRHGKALLGLNLFILVIGAFSILTLKPQWTASAQLILPNPSSDLNANLGKLGNLSDEGIQFSQQVNPLNTLRSIMNSDEVIGKLWKTDPEKQEYPRLDLYKSLFKVSPQSETTIISVDAQGSTPELAEKRANAFISVFKERLNELRQDDGKQRTEFLQKELEQAFNNLQTAERTLANFKQTSGLVNNDSQTDKIVISINNLKTLEAQTLAEAQARKTEVAVLSSRLGLTPNIAVQSLKLKEDTNYQYLRQKLSEVEAALVEAQSKFLPTHPLVRNLLEQRNRLLSQQQRFLTQATGEQLTQVKVDSSIGNDSAPLMQQLILAESQFAALEQQAEKLRNQINQLSAELKAIPKDQAKLNELQQQTDIAEGIYNGLVARVKESKLNAFGAYPSVQILDQPRAGDKPSGAGKRPIILGIILASVFGSVALALWLESGNPLLNVKDIHTVNIPVLRSIPRFKSFATGNDSQLETSIEYQRLASAVSMILLPNRRLLVSSAIAGEGKTTVTMGLAIALTSLGFRVLMVDADINTTQLTQRFGVPLGRQLDFPSLPISIRPNLDLLTIIPQGENINEFISRGGFEKALNFAQTTKDYDYVLIDSMPLTLTSESLLMALVVNNVLLVVSPGNSYRNPFNDSINLLKRHQARVVGLVVNRVETPNEGYLYEQQITKEVNS
ncbi:GumC family protein [[Phormidium] sp. LEGE 05292]|uniref:GumC family protein n=1 Tax=[Phormidium] sp. LEGE 05292 TaxID=767427 RepID=UPI00187FE4C6|nr:P-loop NTPase [Phormidium sp. LEGE 05292]